MQQIFYDIRRAIPKPLNDWHPTFGDNWQIANKKEIFNGEPHLNLFWQLELSRIIANPENFQEKEIKDEKSKILYEPQSAKDIKLSVLERAHIEIQFEDGKKGVHSFKELPMFWDKRKNQPNFRAGILIDLVNTKDGLLRANNPYHMTFGKSNKPINHISELSKGFSSFIKIFDLETTHTKRFFKSMGSGNNQIWIPKFQVGLSLESEMMSHLKEIKAQEHKTTKQVAKEFAEIEAQERDYELNGVSIVGEKELKQSEYLDDRKLNPELEQSFLDNDEIEELRN